VRVKGRGRADDGRPHPCLATPLLRWRADLWWCGRRCWPTAAPRRTGKERLMTTIGCDGGRRRCGWMATLPWRSWWGGVRGGASRDRRERRRQTEPRRGGRQPERNTKMEAAARTVLTDRATPTEPMWSLLRLSLAGGRRSRGACTVTISSNLDFGLIPEKFGGLFIGRGLADLDHSCARSDGRENPVTWTASLASV
jgi:hypothetical protein